MGLRTEITRKLVLSLNALVRNPRQPLLPTSRWMAWSAFIVEIIALAAVLGVRRLGVRIEGTSFWPAIVLAVEIAVVMGSHAINWQGFPRTSIVLSLILIAITLIALSQQSLSYLNNHGYYLLTIPLIISDALLPFAVTVFFAIALSLCAMILSSSLAHALTVPWCFLSMAFLIVATGVMRRRATQTRHDDLQRRHAHDLAHLRTHDPLTGLPNRTSFNKEVAGRINDRPSHQAVALIIIDLDNLKQINTVLSHNGGDAILFTVGTRLSAIAQRRNLFVGRRGGDEFGAVAYLASLEEIEELVATIQEAINTEICVMGHCLAMTASAGVAVAPFHGSTPEEIIACADSALIEAKKKGKNDHVVYSSHVTHTSYTHLALAHDIPHAIERGQLQAVFQLQFNAGLHTWSGAETLVRWNHPAQGMLAPSTFIPIAEETGTITSITEFVLREAIRHLAEPALRDSRPDFSISVNVSARDLTHTDLPKRIADLLDTYRVDASRLEIELTENIMFPAITTASTTLRKLQEMGVRIAVDDFGAGYATIRQIAEFPIDKIKIDKSFVATMTEQARGDAAIASIIELARRLNIEVIAEGVESLEHVQRYRWLGCHCFQGYYYARPIPWERLPLRTGQHPVIP